MQILEPYIPKEYLALRINYCKKMLAELPEVKMKLKKIRGIRREVYSYGNRYCLTSSNTGKALRGNISQRKKALSDLSRLEGLWLSEFTKEPSPDFAPCSLIRKFSTNGNETVVINKDFFESLKNDSNPYHLQSKTFYYNGTYYRSSAERDIARYYTEHGIPFKYEPEIWIKGLNHPVYPDFVIYIEELDLCKFHEHFGIKNSADYNRITATKIENYAGAGLLPNLDVFYTFDSDGAHFDTRTLDTTLNAVICNSLFCLE